MRRPRKLLILLAAVAAVGCQPFAQAGFTPGAPVESVQNKAAQALIIAWRAFDTLLSAVDALQAAGAIQAGSPRALRIANALETARNALNAATEAVRVGSAADYTQALSRAQQALADARAALGGK